MEESVPPVPPVGEIDPITGLKIDPETGKPIDPATGLPMSKNQLKKFMKPKKEKKGPSPKPANTSTGEKKVKKKKKEEIIYNDSTPLGEKKIIEGINPETYQPKYVEAAWQAWWEKCGFYSPNVEKALKTDSINKFVMVIPPPNVTGSLHLGHALTTAVEDTLTRWHRMQGKITLWVPGTDHAGIATQSVVEKRLKKEEDVSRYDLGREKFIKRVWEWKNEFGNKITTQIRCLAASVDWSREAFTMDSNLSKAVTEAFVTFHEDGILYRDTRLINWSCALQSAISEIEVEKIELKGKTFLAVPNHTLKDKYEFGVITSFAYQVDGSEEEIVVATTRLETMLGDTAVAVHPDDPKYKHLHGKFVKHPFIDRKIPIITDSVLVDMNFGTGAVKITPAHDPNDYQCGKRHDLDFIIVLNKDGKIATNGGDFAGMMRYDARISMEEKMKEMGIYRGKDANPMVLGICQRSGDIIEPMLTPQWYVNCKSMATRACDAVRSGELRIIPDMYNKTWFHWLEGIHDWCISRQLWWGHRIPAYFARIKGETPQLDKNDPAHNKRWVVQRTKEQAAALATELLKVDESEIELEQDEDVLDTWFSSGLFPFSVFGWPNNTEDLKAFYPTQLLETGADILFFWVARMVMMGLHLTDTLPFKTVYLHAMVRDKYGRKMSKSLGNVVDPLEVINGCELDQLIEKIAKGNLPEKEIKKAIEGQKSDFPDGIPECGADALRFGLLAYTAQGSDINLDLKRVVGYRQFCNKLWNACRFAQAYISDFLPVPDMHLTVIHSPWSSVKDLYILSKLNKLIKGVQKSMEEYVFGEVVNQLHSFFLYDFCDLYLELVKPVVNNTDEDNDAARKCVQVTLFHCLETYLRLIHPLMPFVSEELWQRLPNLSNYTDIKSIMISPYPTYENDLDSSEMEERMELIHSAIKAARSIRVECNVPPGTKPIYYFVCNNEIAQIISAQVDDFITLVKATALTRLDSIDEAPKSCSTKVVNDSLTLFMDLAGAIDVQKELTRLEKEEKRIKPMIEQYHLKQSHPDYETNVPEKVRDINASKLAGYEKELEAVMTALDNMRALL